ncbi:hypothetical protein GLU60_00930 [Nanohaloarchaea archaeon H01]|nr:hypothetical protein [Nanohaloarchaea archaeon H01]
MEMNKLVFGALPEPVEGVNLVCSDEDIPVFQALLAENLVGNSEAVWIDVGNESSTYELSKLGGEKMLESVRIGRAFTPFQHYSLVNQLGSFLDPETEILVFPNIDRIYLEGQTGEDDSRQLFMEMWNHLTNIVEQEDLKLLVSVSRSEFGYQVRLDKKNSIKVENTGQGWKFESGGSETFLYRKGRSLQTTLPYWQKQTEKVEVRN